MTQSIKPIDSDVDNQPLIYTSNGNIPIASLTYQHRWIDNEYETTFVEEYLLGGEIVKRSVHVMKKQGVLVDGMSAALG